MPYADFLKKTLSFVLIFSMLFSMTFRLPMDLFLASSYALDDEYYDLVSVIVDEETYDGAKGKIVRYARDVQAALPNTKVIILPTPSDASVLDIASLNEALYFEGQKSLEEVDYQSRLVGTVIMGKIPVPVVFDSGLSGKSILPYVDFEEKTYIYSHESQKYERSESAGPDIVPEVWHGVISPNTGSSDDDIAAIRDYLDKNHSFYSGTNQFDQDLIVLDGTDEAVDDEYEPYVFYYDQFRENDALKYQEYLGYEMYLQNIEDITYNRYTKELADRIKDQLLGAENAELAELFSQVNPDFDYSAYTNTGPDISDSSDILTRYVTDNATNQFFEIFNPSTLGEMRKQVYNAGRYNEGGTQVNVDMPAFLITVLDSLSSEVIKNVNTTFEKDIEALVANGLSRKIAIPVAKSNPGNGAPNSNLTCRSDFTAYYYGTQAGSISSADQCSIFRGSYGTGSTLVEMNRGYNVQNAQEDVNLCGPGFDYNYSAQKLTEGADGYWGGATPVNLDVQGTNFANLTLNSNNPRAAIVPIFDPLGAKENFVASNVITPLDCYTDISVIETYKEEEYHYETGPDGEGESEYICRIVFDLPMYAGDEVRYYDSYTGTPPVQGIEGSSPNSSQERFCRSTNTLSSFGGPTLLEAMAYNDSTVPVVIPSNTSSGGACTRNVVSIDGNSYSENKTTECRENITGGSVCSCQASGGMTTVTYTYKTIPSYILHISPTDEEFGAQVSSMYTPSLPVDSDRYIDFIAAGGGSTPEELYRKIYFPQLFRVDLSETENITFESTSQKIKEYLDDASSEINAIINASSPETLSGNQAELFALLSTGEFPTQEVDLYQDLIDKPLEIHTSGTQAKQVSYYDTLVFAVYWNNLKTVSAKYKFIFEEYLSNQFSGDAPDYLLPQAKNAYEMSYLAAPGDSQNMYIKLDPEQKMAHSYAEIIAENASLRTAFIAQELDMSLSDEEDYSCGPPDGVNIFQWFPAVICWMEEMLPPKASVYGKSCGSEEYTEEQKEKIKACDTDTNQNAINDCLEENLVDGSLFLYSDKGRYFYNSPGKLTSEIYTKDDELAFFDNASQVSHTLTRLELLEEDEDGNPQIQVIYDINSEQKNKKRHLENAQEYISFQESIPTARRGRAQTFFYGRGYDVNAYFQSSLTHTDAQGNISIDLQSEELRVEVRGDRMFLDAYVFDASENSYWLDTSIRAFDDSNVCLADIPNGVRDEVIEEVYSLSEANQKLLLSLKNISLSGNNLGLSYPLDIEVYNGNTLAFQESGIGEDVLSESYGFFTGEKSGEYDVYITDSNGYRAHKSIQILPELAEDIKINLSSNILEADGGKMLSLVSLYDAYENLAAGDIYRLEARILGGGAVFSQNKQEQLSLPIIEGYTNLELEATNSVGEQTLQVQLYDMQDNMILSKQKKFQVVDGIKIDWNIENIKAQVGGGKYEFTMRAYDKDGVFLEDFNSQVFPEVSSSYASIIGSNHRFKNGEAKVSLRTKNLASPSVDIALTVQGGVKIYNKSFRIRPELPMYIDLNVSQDKFEASEDASVIVQAVLKDRFGNDVFTDSQTKLKLEISDSTQMLGRVEQDQIQVENGLARFRVYGSELPGTIHYKVTSLSDLSENTFKTYRPQAFALSDLSIPGLKNNSGLSQRGEKFFTDLGDDRFIAKHPSIKSLKKSLEFGEISETLQQRLVDFWREQNEVIIRGVSENAGSLESYYFWDGEAIQDGEYTSLYSVLLGAPYGDITQEGYLAGDILFDPNNQALSVTSILNDPYEFSDIIRVSGNDGLKALPSYDVLQDISLEPGVQDSRIVYEVFNEALGQYIASIYIDQQDLDNLEIQLLDESYTLEQSGEQFVLKDSAGNRLLRYSPDTGWKKFQGTTLLDLGSENGYVLGVVSEGDIIAQISFATQSEVHVTREVSVRDTKLESLDNIVLVYLNSESYSARELYDNSGVSYALYYHDPFLDDYSLNRLHSGESFGLEAIYETQGLAWEKGNMLMLSVASGEPIGRASQKYQSFSLINLGDPVVSLKPLSENIHGTNTPRSFDRSIGEILAQDDLIADFELFDYNNDNYEDVVLIYKNGYIGLLEGGGINQQFINHGNLVYSSDYGMPENVEVGDFTGDGFDDIFFVDADGDGQFYNNFKKDFTRIDTSEVFSLSGAIIQAESYDMDADGKSDIVTLDDLGQIHIFYGRGEAESPDFRKKFVGDGYALEIAETSLSFGGAVYFDGVASLDPEGSSYLRDITLEYLDSNSEDAPEFVNEDFVQSLMFVRVPYHPTFYTLDEEVESGDLDGLAGLSGPIADFANAYRGNTNFENLSLGKNLESYFLRSEYADTMGLKIKKKYSDANGGTLQSGDMVYYDVTFKNNTGDRLENIAYIDNLPEYLYFDNEELIYGLGDADEQRAARRSGVDNYEILLDGIYLNPGEVYTVRYELRTYPLSYGHIQLGLFESGELGDDIYGDIILQQSEKNCGREAKIYKSSAARSYIESITEPVCDTNAISVGDTFPELQDSDNDGIPDFLDNLGVEKDGISMDVSNSGAIQENFDKLESIADFLYQDSDGDGIPDEDDSMESTPSSLDFMASVDALNGAVDDIAAKMDGLMQNFSCGFAGDGCYNTSQLNWAPLVPGGDPTFMGYPIGDGLRVDEGIPIFSAFTGIPVPNPSGCFEIPGIFPASSNSFDGSCYGVRGGGGSLGATSPSNFIRMYATQTLTGGKGIAVCFNGPAMAAGNAIPPGVSPLVPGGNCIVAAAPLDSCQGGEGDPSSLGYPSSGDFGVIHANCDGEVNSQLTSAHELSSSFVQDYFEYLETGVIPGSMYQNYVASFESIDLDTIGGFSLPSQPLLNIGSGEGMLGADISLNPSALTSGDFGEILDINNRRTSGFPGFLMGWVESQLDEIMTSFTNLPNITIILPDFSGMFDGGWGKDFSAGLEKQQEQTLAEQKQAKQEQEARKQSLSAQKESLDCSGDDRLSCMKLDLELKSLGLNSSYQDLQGSQSLSGIKEAYEFIGRIPVIDIETETVSVEIPWIESSELHRAITDAKLALQSYKQEIKQKSEAWSMGAACLGTPDEIAACQERNEWSQHITTKTNAFIASLEQNIDAMESYADFPGHLQHFLGLKQELIDYAICVIEAYAEVMGDWIAENGKRAQAWAEAIVTIKAALKSWQLFVDVFNDYDAQCHECKNERGDLNTFTFQLISAVIPSPPILEMPSLPDVTLDLSNIRMGLTLYVPEFDLNMRPVLLPVLPELTLPDVPSANFSLEPLPVLPLFELPELPKLPEIPTVELPNLPPPPKLPKMFGSVEVVLNIGKLVTKAMCIMKGSAFVPEWRAGDQIAFITERNGYLPMDFIDLQPPAFSYAAVSEVNIGVYTNLLQFENSTLLEAAEMVLGGLNFMPSNFDNLFQHNVSNLDFSSSAPDDLDVSIDLTGQVSSDTMSRGAQAAGLILLAMESFYSHFQLEQDVWLEAGDFTAYMNSQLSQDVLLQDDATSDLRKLWRGVAEYDFSAENKATQELQEFNLEKYTLLEEILLQESQILSKQQEILDSWGEESLFEQVSELGSPNAASYTKALEPYNIQTLDAALDLLNGDDVQAHAFRSDLDASAREFMSDVRGGLTAYEKSLLAAESGNTDDGVGGSCIGNGGYEFNYEGLYVLEDNKNYKLLDYSDMLLGDEEAKTSDIDNDGDNDILFLSDGALHFKENRSSDPAQTFITSNPKIIKVSNNPFYNGEYIEAVNNFDVGVMSDNALNVRFDASSRDDINKYELTYHTHVDRYLSEVDSYTPRRVESTRIDAYVSEDFLESDYPEEGYILGDQEVSLVRIGNVSNLVLTSKQYFNIKDDLEAGRSVTLTRDSYLYSRKKSFTLRYKYPGSEEEFVVQVPKRSQIRFAQNIEVVSLRGNAFVIGDVQQEYSGEALQEYVGLPLVEGASFEYLGNKQSLTEQSYVEINFASGEESFLDLREVQEYRLYNLGALKRESYAIRLKEENDMYYAQIRAGSQGDTDLGTLSHQVLIAPQIYADDIPPEIGLRQKIRIPVYQSQEVDLTPFIYEEGGVLGIQEVFVDMDLSADTSGDGNTLNDRDTLGVVIQRSNTQISLDFGPFDALRDDYIIIGLVDDNGNTASQKIGFEVYTPSPDITNIDDEMIEGRIDESLENEPIRMYRYRGGQLTKLLDGAGNDIIATQDDGSYNFTIPEENENLLLQYSGSHIADIDEFTGRVDMKSLLGNVRVYPSNRDSDSAVYPRIEIEYLGEAIFSQYLKIADNNIHPVSEFSGVNEEGIYVKLLNSQDYKSYILPRSIGYNPGAYILDRVSGDGANPLMILHPDGRLFLKDNSVALIYRSYEDYVSFVLIDTATGAEISQILFYVSADYIMAQ